MNNHITMVMNEIRNHNTLLMKEIKTHTNQKFNYYLHSFFIQFLYTSLFFLWWNNGHTGNTRWAARTSKVKSWQERRHGKKFILKKLESQERASDFGNTGTPWWNSRQSPRNNFQRTVHYILSHIRKSHPPRVLCAASRLGHWPKRTRPTDIGLSIGRASIHFSS